MKKEDDVKVEKYSDDISNIELSIRSYNCLKKAGITTISRLMNMNLEELKGINHINDRCILEIRTQLNKYIEKDRLDRQEKGEK